MLKLYRNIQVAITTEFKKYLGDDVSTVTNADAEAEQPDYPYIAVKLHNPEIRISGSYKFPVFEAQYFILAVSDKSYEALDLGHAIRHLLFKRQPLHDMRKKRVIPLNNVTSVQFNRSFLPTHMEFVDGGNFTFAVHDPDKDDTQKGYIDHIKASMNDSPFHADK